MIFHQIYCRKCDLFFMAKTMKAPCIFCGKIMLAVYHKDNNFNLNSLGNAKMKKPHKTCAECRNNKPWEQNLLLCKRDGIEVCPDDSCGDFVSKENEIKGCKNCEFNIPYCIKEKLKSIIFLVLEIFVWISIKN